jgi:hypothetical protein
MLLNEPNKQVVIMFCGEGNRCGLEVYKSTAQGHYELS